MKATINKLGCLVLTPETEMEQYALDTWYDALSNDLTVGEVESHIIVREYEDDSSGM